jgi:hypothetical protein
MSSLTAPAALRRARALGRRLLGDLELGLGDRRRRSLLGPRVIGLVVAALDGLVERLVSAARRRLRRGFARAQRE